MTSKVPRWPWHYHALLLLFCFAMSAFYVWLRPGHREARIGLVVVSVVLAVTLTAVQWQGRKRRGG